jgi:CDP-diacylglycerol--glycerol-3-phosphate 3-phosphatidyltransferase
MAADSRTKSIKHGMTITERLRVVFTGPLTFVAKGIARLGISPNALTILGLILAIIPAALVLWGKYTWAGVAYLLCVPFDALDGAVARETGSVSKFGAFLDSTLDRYGEAILLTAIGYHLAQQGDLTGVALAFVTLFGSLMVSYTRARSEGLAIDNKVGLMTRVERVVITILGLLTGHILIMLGVLAITTHVTVIQRIVHTYLQSRKSDGQP